MITKDAARTICWFSAGAASAVATKLIIGERARRHPQSYDLLIARCDTGAEDEDNDRFARDCEAWFGLPVQSLKSAEYKDTWDVWEKRRYTAGISGAPCTLELKVKPRLAMQRPGDLHVFGYTADRSDVARFVALGEHWPDLRIRAPLIERGITKAACRAMLARAGIKEPRTYAMGFPNANCMPCSKATSPAYLALVREHFPDRFWRYAKLCRELGVKPVRLPGGERVYPDEIPADFPTRNADAPECDFLCALAEQDLSGQATIA